MKAVLSPSSLPFVFLPSFYLHGVWYFWCFAVALVCLMVRVAVICVGSGCISLWLKWPGYIVFITFIVRQHLPANCLNPCAEISRLLLAYPLYASSLVIGCSASVTFQRARPKQNPLPDYIQIQHWRHDSVQLL